MVIATQKSRPSMGVRRHCGTRHILDWSELAGWGPQYYEKIDSAPQWYLIWGFHLSLFVSICAHYQSHLRYSINSVGRIPLKATCAHRGFDERRERHGKHRTTYSDMVPHTNAKCKILASQERYCKIIDYVEFQRKTFLNSRVEAAPLYHSQRHDAHA